MQAQSNCHARFVKLSVKKVSGQHAAKTFVLVTQDITMKSGSAEQQRRLKNYGQRHKMTYFSLLQIVLDY